VKLAADLQLVPRSRTRGSIHPLPLRLHCTVKHRDNIFTLKNGVGRPRCRLEDNIKKGSKLTGWDDVELDFGSGCGSVAGCCERGTEPSGSVNCWYIFPE
jgi:hypothetical protein